MDLHTYQRRAMKFAKFSQSEYPFLALSEEVGEVNGKCAKFLRKHPGKGINDIPYAITREIALELGDVLWQLAACAEQLGWTLSDIAIMNLNKLEDRDNRGQIVGEGDYR